MNQQFVSRSTVCKNCTAPICFTNIHRRELQSKAISLGLATHAVADAGRTQVESGSVTVLGIFGPDFIVNEVTGHLKLL